MSTSQAISSKTKIRQVKIEQLFDQNVSVPSQNPAVVAKSNQEISNLANVVTTPQ
jgi:hypothetical protein